MSGLAQPLRFWRSMAATLLAISVGGLLEGTCTYGLIELDATLLGLPGMVAVWIATAGCLYGANEQWIGRTREQRRARFLLCLLIAMPIQVGILIVGVNVLERLGGSLWPACAAQPRAAVGVAGRGLNIGRWECLGSGKVGSWELPRAYEPGAHHRRGVAAAHRDALGLPAVSPALG